MIKHPQPAASYLSRIESLEHLHALLSRLYAGGHALPNDVLVLLDAVDGGTRSDRGKVRLP